MGKKKLCRSIRGKLGADLDGGADDWTQHVSGLHPDRAEVLAVQLDGLARDVRRHSVRKARRADGRRAWLVTGPSALARSGEIRRSRNATKARKARKKREKNVNAEIEKDER